MNWKQEFLYSSGHYLDSSATSQQLVVSQTAEMNFARSGRANSGRGFYPLAQETDKMLQDARAEIALCLQAQEREILFFPGATAAARSLVQALAGKHIALARFEHHATILPAMQYSGRLSWIDLQEDGQISKASLLQALEDGAEVVIISHISNTLGGENNLEVLSSLVRQAGARFIVDGAQGPGRADLASSGFADAYFFSGHKCYGPTGIGILFAREDWLQQLPSLQLGGGVVQEVTEGSFRLHANPPSRHEGGTLPLGQIAGLAPALSWIASRQQQLQEHEIKLADATRQGIKNLGGEIMGDRHGPGPVSFRLPGVPGHDVVEIASRWNVSLRAGKHCAHPIHDYLGWEDSVRASFGPYNDQEDIEALLGAMEEAISIFS